MHCYKFRIIVHEEVQIRVNLFVSANLISAQVKAPCMASALGMVSCQLPITFRAWAWAAVFAAWCVLVGVSMPVRFQFAHACCQGESLEHFVRCANTN